VLPNIALPYSSSNYQTWSDWISFTSGAMQEHFTKWSTGTTQHLADVDWKWRQGFMAVTQKAGKIFLGVTYAPMSDVRSMLYARASFLLDWDGGPSALMFEPSDPEQQDPYSGAWTQDIGTPLGARYQVGSVWRRNYSGGTVVVNPSATATETVALGAPFVAAEGTTVTSVLLAPTTGAVLRASGNAVPPPIVPRAVDDVQSPARVVAWGAIRVRHGKAWFGVRIGVRAHSTAIRYVDRRSHVRFRATRIDRVKWTGRTLRIRGRGVSRGRPLIFTLAVRDGVKRSADRFAIRLGKRYAARGRLAAGTVVIEQNRR
jgi:hypothetical protein